MGRHVIAKTVAWLVLLPLLLTLALIHVCAVVLTRFCTYVDKARDGWHGWTFLPRETVRMLRSILWRRLYLLWRRLYILACRSDRCLEKRYATHLEDAGWTLQGIILCMDYYLYGFDATGTAGERIPRKYSEAAFRAITKVYGLSR